MAKTEYSSAVDEGALKRARIKALKGKLKETGLQKGLELGGKKIADSIGLPGLSDILGGSGLGANQSIVGNTIVDSMYGPVASAAPSGGLGATLGAYAGPAAALALAGMAASKLIGGKRSAKEKEPARLKGLVKRGIIDPEKVPQFKETLVDGEYTGKDLVGRAELYDLFGGEASPEALAKFGDAAITKGLFDQERGTVYTKPTMDLMAGRKEDAARGLGEVAKLAKESGLSVRDEVLDRFMGKTDPGAGLAKQLGNKIRRDRGEAQVFEQSLFDLYQNALGAASTQNVDTSPQVPTFSKPLDLTSAMPTLGTVPAGVKPIGQQVSKERFAELFPDLTKKRDQSRGV